MLYFGGEVSPPAPGFRRSRPLSEVEGSGSGGDPGALPSLSGGPLGRVFAKRNCGSGAPRSEKEVTK